MTKNMRIPAPLRPYTDGRAEVPVEGETVGAALNNLTAQYPGLRPHLFDERGELRSFVNLFLNDEDIRHLQGVETAIQEGDRLMLIPSIAGG
ncbi:MAG: MoaD/ThiS family protein [Anaerolineales bacterium]|nr:MoaD/ThiS family protein [Anaerolineales bacterium]